jgi:cytidyltransferase-like protein
MHVNTTIQVMGAHLDLAGFRIYDEASDDPYKFSATAPFKVGSTFVGQCQRSMNECKDRTNDFGFVRVKDILPLKYLTFMGRAFLIPNNETAYLIKYYGNTWNVVDREGKGNWHAEDDTLHVSESNDEMDISNQINLNAVRLRSPRIYVDVVGDLLHYGHVNLFKQARKWGASLIVGVHNDSTVSSYKRRPIMTMEERIKAIEEYSMVDMVLPDAPLKVTKEYIHYHKISLIVHGNDTPIDKLKLMYGDAMELGIFKTVPYTKGVSTSEIIDRIVKRSQMNDDHNRLSKKK